MSEFSVKSISLNLNVKLLLNLIEPAFKSGCYLTLSFKGIALGKARGVVRYKYEDDSAVEA